MQEFSRLQNDRTYAKQWCEAALESLKHDRFDGALLVWLIAEENPNAKIESVWDWGRVV